MITNRRRERGQSLVEFALVLPLFMTLVFGVLDMGRVVWASNSLANAAREATRFAIVHGGTASDSCPVGPPYPDANIPAASSSCPHPSPSKQSIIDAATNYAIAGGTSVTVSVCYGVNCSGSTDTFEPDGTTAADNRRGTPVTVTVTSAVPMLTGSLLGFGTFHVSGSSTMLVNH